MLAVVDAVRAGVTFVFVVIAGDGGVAADVVLLFLLLM